MPETLLVDEGYVCALVLSLVPTRATLLKGSCWEDLRRGRFQVTTVFSVSINSPQASTPAEKDERQRETKQLHGCAVDRVIQTVQYTVHRKPYATKNLQQILLRRSPCQYA